MATPESRSVELDPLEPSFDGDLDAVGSDQNQVVEADTRELSAYGFDSHDKTLVGIGISGSADSSTVGQFDSSDRTLIGIAPQPEGVPTPHSEPPGPFIASDDDQEAQDRRPREKSAPWVLALSAVLVAAAVVALLRGVAPHTTAPHTTAPHTTAPRLHSATTAAPLPTANETRTRYVRFEAAAATSAETSALEVPITQAPEAPQPAPPPATAQREKQPELAPRGVTPKSADAQLLGVLDVSSNSPAGVLLDGRPLGKAPCVIQLPSGPHTVLFVHPERGRMSVTVNVRAGQTTNASADF